MMNIIIKIELSTIKFKTHNKQKQFKIIEKVITVYKWVIEGSPEVSINVSINSNCCVTITDIEWDTNWNDSICFIVWFIFIRRLYNRLFLLHLIGADILNDFCIIKLCFVCCLIGHGIIFYSLIWPFFIIILFCLRICCLNIF